MMLVIKRDEIIKICEKIRKEYSMKFNRCADIIEREPDKARSLTLVAMDMMDDIISQITYAPAIAIKTRISPSKEFLDEIETDIAEAMQEAENSIMRKIQRMLTYTETEEKNV